MKLTKKQLEEALRLACENMGFLPECVNSVPLEKCLDNNCTDCKIAYFKEQAIKKS